MIPFLSIRYSFSRSSGHRRRALRIVFSVSLSLAVLMVTISVMDYLQEGRFERIREARSFDMVISGNAVSEMKERYRDASVFLYGETEVLADGGVYTLRYIDASYDGALRIIYGDNTSLLVPYSLYMASDAINMTALEAGRSGVVLPVTRRVEISGAFSTALGYSFDSSLLFMPLSEGGGIRMHKLEGERNRTLLCVHTRENHDVHRPLSSLCCDSRISGKQHTHILLCKGKRAC